MRLTLAVLVLTVALTAVGLAFAAAACLATAALVWVGYSVVAPLLDPAGPPPSRLEADERRP